MGDEDERWQQELLMAPPFAEAFGARLREVREGQQPAVTTEQIARSARQLGLSWHRTTVGQIERGKRPLTAVELLLLPRIYAAPLQELLPPGTTWLTEKTAVSREILWRSTIMKPDEWSAHGWALLRDGPGRWSTDTGRKFEDMDVEQIGAMVDVISKALAGPWPKGAQPEHRATPDEAEIKAASRLSTTPHYVAYAARRTWGRGLSDERDERLQARGEIPTDRRALQAARGHVTRALLKELEPVVQELEQRRDEPDEPINPNDLGPIRFERGDDAG